MTARLKLQHASVAARNAAFDAVKADLLELIEARAPGFVKGQLKQHLESQEGVHEVLHIIDDAFEAAEKAEAK